MSGMHGAMSAISGHTEQLKAENMRQRQTGNSQQDGWAPVSQLALANARGPGSLRMSPDCSNGGQSAIIGSVLEASANRQGADGMRALNTDGTHRPAGMASVASHMRAAEEMPARPGAQAVIAPDSCAMSMQGAEHRLHARPGASHFEPGPEQPSACWLCRSCCRQRMRRDWPGHTALWRGALCAAEAGTDFRDTAGASAHALQ